MLNIYDDGSIDLTRGNSADLTVQPTKDESGSQTGKNVNVDIVDE